MPSKDEEGKEMKYVLILSLLSGCSDIPDKLNRRILTDLEGCKYIVEKNVGDTVFLHQLKDFKCNPHTGE